MSHWLTSRVRRPNCPITGLQQYFPFLDICHFVMSEDRIARLRDCNYRFVCCYFPTSIVRRPNCPITGLQLLCFVRLQWGQARSEDRIARLRDCNCRSLRCSACTSGSEDRKARLRDCNQQSRRSSSNRLRVRRPNCPITGLQPDIMDELKTCGLCQKTELPDYGIATAKMLTSSPGVAWSEDRIARLRDCNVVLIAVQLVDCFGQKTELPDYGIATCRIVLR